MVMVALAAITFPVLFFVAAPYGRHTRRGWGPTIDDTLGWVIMEAPSALVFGGCFALGGLERGPVALAFLALWELHYVHRAFVYPIRRPPTKKRMPVAVMLMAFVFTSCNSYLNGRWLFGIGPTYSASWLLDLRFVIGAPLFVAGFLVNLHADTVLMRLRRSRKGDEGYKIPEGGLYRYISCPNYFGEIIEWIGFAIATWSLPALVFAVWTIANLAPRAISNHKWYRDTFPDYPRGRKALVPFVV